LVRRWVKDAGPPAGPASSHIGKTEEKIKRGKTKPGSETEAQAKDI
jgi:hypothetical protein